MRPQTQNLLFGAGGANAPADLGLLVLRVVAGLALALGHGLGKLPPSEGFVTSVGELGFPAPALFAWLATLAEFGGGLLLVVGLMTRPAALAVAFNMAVAFFVSHAADPFPTKEKALLFGVIALALLLTGAGRYSLDALITKDRTKPIWR